MTILDRNFFFLSLVGLWKPVHFAGWKTVGYRLYSVFILIEMTTYIVSAFMDILLSTFELHSFTDNISLIVNFIIVIIKLYCLTRYSDVMVDIEKRLEKRLVKPEDHEEQTIYQHYLQTTKNIFIYYPMLFVIAVTWYSLAHITSIRPPETLPYLGWFPYNYSSTVVFWPTAIFQLCTILNAAAAHLSFDPLLPCMFCYICAHIDILKHRFHVILKKLEAIDVENGNLLKKLEMEKQWIGDWVEYHIEILNLVKKINSIFTVVIFIQYFGSAFMLCTIAYLMSHDSVKSMTFMGNLSYFVAMNFQIFFQCMSANQMTSEFVDLRDEIGTTNWFLLSSNARKSTVIILSSTLRPVVFTSGFFLSLTLESFTKMKTKLNLMIVKNLSLFRSGLIRLDQADQQIHADFKQD